MEKQRLFSQVFYFHFNHQLVLHLFKILSRSKIQGLGLYAARDLEKHTMVIEYIGEIIRSQLCDYREKLYEAKVILLF